MSDRSTVLLEHHLKELKLPTFLREYGKVSGQCAAEGVDHPGYLLRLSELELIDRHHRMVDRRIKAARFPATKSLDTFDFLAMPSVNKHLVMQLARCAFTDEQVRWLEAIRDHIAGSVSMTPSNFQYAPFNQQGGLGKAWRAVWGGVRGTALRTQPGAGGVDRTCGALSTTANMTVERPTISSQMRRVVRGR